MPQLFIFKFSDFSLTFQNLSFPWLSTKFPDLEKISFFRHFSVTVATLIYKCLTVVYIVPMLKVDATMMLDHRSLYKLVKNTIKKGEKM